MRYITVEDVAIRLRGKIRFTEDTSDESKMPYALLKKLIDEAEVQVELDLSPRYQVPFVTDSDSAFKNLPDHTKFLIKTLSELMSVMRVLETDFGRGSAVSGDKYFETQQKRYEEMIDRCVGKIKDSGQWKYPPLPSLKLAAHNHAADDGYAGAVLSHSQFGDGDFPGKQINDPSENFWNGTVDE